MYLATCHSLLRWMDMLSSWAPKEKKSQECNAKKAHCLFHTHTQSCLQHSLRPGDYHQLLYYRGTVQYGYTNLCAENVTKICDGRIKIDRKVSQRNK